jgi:hypothetical protein
VHRHTEEQVIRHLPAVTEQDCLTVRIQRADQQPRMPADAPVSESGENDLRCLR